MGWLRRTISVIFATAVAIGVDLVFVPVAALIDPVTRGAGFALTQYAVLALDSDFAVGRLAEILPCLPNSSGWRW